MWRTRDGSSKRFSDNICRDFNAVAFSPDGRYLAAGNDDGYLRLWDARSGHLLKKWVHSQYVMSVAFRPDGKGMASGGYDDKWKNWNYDLPRGQSHPSEHIVSDGIEKETFACEGHTVCSIFSSFPPVYLTCFLDHQSIVSSISFSSDSRWVVTSSGDRTSRIWNATTGAWVCTLKGHTDYVRESDFCPVGNYLVTGADDCQVMLWRYCEVDE
jgi:WD40 repeat protein